MIETNVIISSEKVTELSKIWRNQGLQIGFTNGCFDLLHPGHIALLKNSIKLCDKLVVGLNSDTSVRSIKGPTRPVQDEMTRAIAISAIQGVSAIVIFNEKTPLKLIQALRPDVIVKGGDYKNQQIVGADLVSSYGGRCEIVELVEGHSTTNLIKHITGS